jgi:hypothetical protein
MQVAFQQLLQSPGQVQRLLQLLSSSSTNGSAPISAPITGTAQPGSWTPPASLDFPQLGQLALYDNGIGNALTFDSKNTVGPSTTQLADDQARLARSYHDASEIDADVDVLQDNINALIENMGLDPALTNISTASTHSPPVPSSGGIPPAQTAADFDFEAFLTAFANVQEGEGETPDVDDKTSASGSAAPGSGSAPGTGAGTTNVFSEQPVVVGRKRTSDVAELALPLPELSKAAATTENTAGGPPRVKRNKK